jgi:predicted SAM-dependent methyltransferase
LAKVTHGFERCQFPLSCPPEHVFDARYATEVQPGVMTGEILCRDGQKMSLFIFKSLIRRLIPKKYHTQVANSYIRWKCFGFKFKCPFCRGHFRKLLPAGLDFPVLKEKNVVGGGYRLNATCPHCYSSDRERLIYLYLKNKTNLFYENLKLLHVAPEENLQKILMVWTNIDYVSADLDSPLAMIKMDITKIPYKDNSFNVVICNHVLEHIPNDRQAMSDLYRVLKPGGWAILQVPISLSLDRTYEDPTTTAPDEREERFGQSDHVRIYAKDYKDRLENVGFTVDVYSFREEFGDSTINKYALAKDEDLYLASKSRWSTARVGPEKGAVVID